MALAPAAWTIIETRWRRRSSARTRWNTSGSGPRCTSAWLRAARPRAHGPVGRRHGALGPARPRPGQPICRLLGGRSDPRAAYASGPYSGRARSVSRVSPRGGAFHRPGFRAMKMKVGVDPAADGRAAARSGRLWPRRHPPRRREPGYTVRPAIQAGRQSRPKGSPGSRSPSRRTTSRDTHVAGLSASPSWREASADPAFRSFFERNALDAGQADLAVAGGFTEARVAGSPRPGRCRSCPTCGAPR